MAEEQDDSQKTEEPTQRRLEEARRKGDIAKSQDVPVWFLLLAGAAILSGAGPIASGIGAPLANILDHPHAFSLRDGGAQHLMAAVLSALAGPMSTIFAVIAIGGLLGHLVQHRPLWTAERIKPDISKLDPMKGLGRMFGPQGWMNLAKAAAKTAAVSAALVWAIWPDAGLIIAAGEFEAAPLLALIQKVAGRLMIAALVSIGVLSGLDYFLQRQSFMRRMRMSRQELRDESRQSEGDPQIKARLRQIRLQRARRRMMQAVPTATVVVTNPTHYSIALRYDPDKDAAPICVAKGVDTVALRIREVAEAAGVPLVENVPLARALHAAVEIDDPVPREHFEAVAKVIGFVLSTARRRQP